MSITDLIRKERESRKLTQAQMAERLNIAQSAYNRIEKGDTDITVKRLAEIAEILNVEVEYLIVQSRHGVPSGDSIKISSPNSEKSADSLEVKHAILKEQLFQILKLYALPYIQYRLVREEGKAHAKEILLKKLPHLPIIRVLLQNSIVTNKEIKDTVEEYVDWFFQQGANI